MDWLGKSSKAQQQLAKNDMESLGIRFEPIVFYPDRNEYELCIELPGCPKDLIKVTYDRPSGKLKVQGQKLKKDFVQQVTVPADCSATGIYGTFQGDFLHIIMPRSKSDLPPSKDAFSKQEDGQKLSSSSDRKTTKESRESVGKDDDKLPARVPAPPPSDRKTTKEVKERVGKDHDKLPARVPATDERAGKDQDKLPARVPAPPPPSDQKKTDEVREPVERERKLPAKRVPTPPPSDRKTTRNFEGVPRLKREGKLPAMKVPAPPPSDEKTTEKTRGIVERDEKIFPEITAPPLSDRETSHSVKELREKYQKTLADPKTTDNVRGRVEKNSSPLRPPPPPPPVAAPAPAPAPAPSNRKTTDSRSRKEVEEDQESPSTAAPASTSSNQKMAEQKEKKSKAKETEKEKPCSGDEKLGLIATVKETGKAALATAMKEENRQVLLIGAAVLAIVVIGAASLRSSNKKAKN